MARRTQTERSTATRTLVLDATLDCLAEVGYAATSTAEIARRAGVSRGAQVHHFPTKASLVAAAARHLYAKRETEFFAAFESLPADQRTPGRAVDLLWSIYSGPTSSASLELIVAGRTDPALHEVVSQVSAECDTAIVAGFTRLFPEAARGPLGADLVRFAFSVLQGAALDRHAGQPDHAEATIGLLRLLADVELPTASRSASPQGATR